MLKALTKDNKIYLDLTNKLVRARGQIFKCKDGYGCNPQVSSTFIEGYFLKNINSKEPKKGTDKRLIKACEITSIIK